jgi:Flp pilus assembly pilin Flp
VAGVPVKRSSRLSSIVRDLRRDETAATLVEYALVVVFIAAVAVVAVRVFGNAILSLFQMSGAAIAAVL